MSDYISRADATQAKPEFNRQIDELRKMMEDL